ncbi:T9SS type A sorting domain-containing protein, partial [candidate division KSB1 bacterium]|nr:T9SS type A sorting domain-containing protein [candidate division KSB1 bacterium]
GAYVNVLFDWDQNGSWGGSSTCGGGGTPRDCPEHVLQNFHVPGGTAGHLGTLDPLPFLIGPNPGFVWARMTITETPISLPWDGSGAFNEGESEDYLIKITPDYVLFDFGDAPFLTVLADNGASHRLFQGICLGSIVDAEEDGQPDDAAMGDDRSGQDDEDGVVFLNEWVAGDTAEVEVTASVGGMLKAWVDYNQDQDWDDAGECVLDIQLAAGKNTLMIEIPDDAKADSTYARFRFSLQPIEDATGPVADGEVEDYRICIYVLRFDFGDAPEPFQTVLAQNGARHLISGLYLGDSIDWEADGIPSVRADGDDARGMDDEDGIEFTRPLVPGYHFDIRVFPSQEGYVSGWVDFNGDGDWDDDYERVLSGREPVAPRTDHPELPSVYSVRIPADAVREDVVARFRIGSTPELPYYGAAVGGEVEDYIVPIGAGMDSLDWGDAPDPPYPTLAASDGARHILGDRTWLSLSDSEPDGQPTLLADGDDTDGNNDEDGIRFLSPIIIGQLADIEYWPADHGFINGWIDFNADGDWDDDQEHCIDDLEVWNAGHPDTLRIKVPETAVSGYTFARFRISVDSGIGYTGVAAFGNVEDYRISIGTSVSVPPGEPDRPNTFALEQNYPNPFNPDTRIIYHLPQPSRVYLAVYNLQGQRIRVLVDGEQSAGIRQVVWDGCEESGQNVGSGVYFYRLQAGEYTAMKKMVLLQ